MGYIKGGNYAMCDVCGEKYRAMELRRRWDGALCCNEDWEPRHPQDFLRGIPDYPQAPVTNPEQPDKFQPQAELNAFGIPVIVNGEPVMQAVASSSADIGIVEYQDETPTPGELPGPANESPQGSQ
jgi:hypothetical protein